MNKKLINFFMMIFLLFIPITNNPFPGSPFFKQLAQSLTTENEKIDGSQEKIFQEIIAELKKQNNLLKEQNKNLNDRANELIDSVKNNNNYLASLKNTAIGVMSLFIFIAVTTFSFPK